MYRKLIGIKGTFTDLADYDPTVYRSLKNILDYEGDDIEEVFMQTFQISYTDVFGHVHVHDLKKDADRIFVNHTNKKVWFIVSIASNDCVQLNNLMFSIPKFNPKFKSNSICRSSLTFMPTIYSTLASIKNFVPFAVASKW